MRETVGILITVIIGYSSFQKWPGLLSGLNECLSNNDPHVVDGALSALCKLCEDHCYMIHKEPEKPLQVLIPKFIGFFHSEHESFRLHSITAVNQFLLDMPGALLANMDQYLKGIFSLASDSSMDVRRQVCIAFSALVERRLENVLDVLEDIIQYMLVHTAQDEDEKLALEACEFWCTIVYTPVCKQVLGKYLPRLIPVLLQAMEYSDFDMDLLHCAENDEMVPDKASEIRPQFNHAKSVNGGEEKEDASEVSGWTLRKCAANALDKLSAVFEGKLLEVLLPELQSRMSADSDWKKVEVSILAIGAISTGCWEAISNFLPDLVPHLISQTSHGMPLVRSISCWALSRYSSWIVHFENGKFYKPVLESLVTCMLSTNKKVQEAACSALSTMEDEGRDLLYPFVAAIVPSFKIAYDKYQAKNLIVLYDTINTLIDTVPGNILSEPVRQHIIPMLLERWERVGDHMSVCQVLECLTNIAIVLGKDFQSYAAPVFERSMQLMEASLARLQSVNDEDVKNILIYAIDLVAGLVTAFGQNVIGLIQDSNLGNVVLACIQSSDLAVRQNSFALVGDLCKNAIDYVRPALGDLIGVLLSNVNPTYPGVCNNATWALGDIAVQIGPEMKPFINPALERFLGVYQHPNAQPILLAHTSVSLGKLCLACPNETAASLNKFLGIWSVQILRSRNDKERAMAFQGLCRVVKMNPEGALEHFPAFCDALARYGDASEGM